MADKNINFNIKVNNKELDLTKASFKQFDEIIKQAKKDLQSLPLNDPRYKVLAADIRTAEEAWKAAKKGATDFNDEMENGDDKVASYRKQIKDATDELFRLKQQFGENSDEVKKQESVIASLRDEQEKFTRSTQDLDDTLAAIPGPIGKIGQGMQMLEGITQNVGAAMTRLGISFKTTDGILKASGIGALVLLVATLAAAIVNAAKKSEALQAAFAAFGDAIGAIFDALKPLTDFFINVFVGAINMVATALSGLASVFGGVNKGFKQESLQLEKTLQLNKRLLDQYNSDLSENVKNRIALQNDYLQKKKELDDDETLSDEKKIARKKELDESYNRSIINLINQRNKLIADANLDADYKSRQADISTIKNQRIAQEKQLDLDKKYEKAKLENQKILLTNQMNYLANSAKQLDKSSTDYVKRAEILYTSITDIAVQIKQIEEQQTNIEKTTGAEKLKNRGEYNKEDVRLVNERSNEILQLTTELIKEENARNLQAAKDALIILKEQHRVELEDAELAGVTLKNLKEKQRAEEKAANEKVRLEQIQFDAYVIQQEIDKQNRLATEVGLGTQEYFNARREIIRKEYEQELLLADGNINKIENARTKQWKALLELDKEGVQSQIDLLNVEYNTLFEGTVAFYDKQRQIEEENYKLAQLNAQGNYDKLEALRKQHEKNMYMIDMAEMQSKIDIEQRKADTTLMIFGGYFDEQRKVEEMRYELRKKQAGDNVAAIEAIEKEHQRFMRESRLAELQLMLDFGTKLAEVASGIFNAISAVNDARMAKELKDAEGNAKAQEEIKKKYFEKNKKAQIAQAYISTFQSAVQAFSAMAGIPVVGPALGAVAAAAAIVTGLANVAKIRATTYDGGGEGSGSSSSSEAAKPAMPNYLRNYEDGGMIGGRRHAEGGTLIEAEKGEAIMTRGAVTMFAPMLSMMNQMGGGAPFAPSLMTTSYDKPNVSKPAEEKSPIIVKSYVVSSDMTREQEKQARLKDLSTL